MICLLRCTVETFSGGLSPSNTTVTLLVVVAVVVVVVEEEEEEEEEEEVPTTLRTTSIILLITSFATSSTYVISFWALEACRCSSLILERTKRSKLDPEDSSRISARPWQAWWMKRETSMYTCVAGEMDERCFSVIRFLSFGIRELMPILFITLVKEVSQTS